MKLKNLFYLAIAVFLLYDFAFSFVQYYELPLDGDLAGGIVPAKDVQAILDDPFGLELLKTQEVHPNPNRYFSHFAFHHYYREIPLFFQDFLIPIESVYFSGALLRLGIQLGFLVVFSLIILPIPQRNIRNFLLIFLLLTPLFQGQGFNRYIGIIDQAATYNFFYALPLLILMVFYSFYKPFNPKNTSFRIPIWGYILMLPLLVILPLSSPLNPGIILIITAIYFANKLWLNLRNKEKISWRSVLNVFKEIPKPILIGFTVISIVSLYSLFLGTYNFTDLAYTIPLAERYARLPLGLWTILSGSVAFPLLLLLISVNVIVLKEKDKSNSSKLSRELKFIGLFCLLYLVLLPLGGYRISRPLIVRYDTMLPITLALIYFFAKSSFLLLKSLRLKPLMIYSFFVFGILFVFHNTDKRYKYQNLCEKDALITLSNSSEPVVELESNCSVVSWQKITDPKQSALNAQLLKLWNVTDNTVLYSSTTEE